MDNIIREIVTLVSLLSLNKSFRDLLTTKLSRTFLRALVWSVSSQIVLVLCASLGDDTYNSFFRQQVVYNKWEKRSFDIQ